MDIAREESARGDVDRWTLLGSRLCQPPPLLRQPQRRGREAYRRDQVVVCRVQPVGMRVTVSLSIRQRGGAGQKTYQRRSDIAHTESARRHWQSACARSRFLVICSSCFLF